MEREKRKVHQWELHAHLLEVGGWGGGWGEGG